MITFTRLLARQLRTVFRRALNVTAKTPSPQVALVADAAGLHVYMHARDVAVTYLQPGQLTAEQYVIPWDFLAECEGGRADPVTLEQRDGRVVLRWTDRDIPRTLTCEPAGLPDDFPSVPEQFTPVAPRFLAALAEAMETADAQTTGRYALDCVQLRGSRGDLAATDGQQMLVQRGFEFPWPDDVLVRRNKLFLNDDLPRDQPVELGRTEQHFVVRTGPWTIWLAIDKENRFPQIDSTLAIDEPAVSTLRLDAADARFLANAVERLPGKGDEHQPVTVDLNGHVAILAKSAQEPQATQLLLSNSQREGEPTRFATNRFYLARAVGLGFREVQSFGPDKAVHCRDEHRHYLWMTLGKDHCLAPDANTVAIESPLVPNSSVSKPASQPRNQPIMSTNRIQHAVEPPAENGDSPPLANGSAPTNSASTTDLLAKAEAAKTTLRAAHTQLSELIVALKRQRRQSQLMRSTLASLKELQTLDV